MATTSEGKAKEEKEGSNLLGPPTFKELENGRFRCVETGHEVVAKDKEFYSQSKRCRLGLVDFALSHKNPPLNMFKQDPLSRSKLVCKLTGDTINKSEEHIWKHINGKRFLNKLEEKEEQKLKPDGIIEEMDDQKPDIVSDPCEDGDKKKNKKKKKNKNKKKKKNETGVDEVISEIRKSNDDESEMRKSSDEESDPEETDFWMPPVGERWDFDDGGDRWGSGSESENESDEMEGAVEDGVVEDGDKESEELSTRTKRMSIEIGPSSFASRKKKSKKSTT